MTHWDTFISHASADKAGVRRLMARLKSNRLKPWVDETGVQYGGLLRDGLQDAIQASKTFVLVWSKAASKSRWVIAELLTAFHLGRFTIPCVLDKTPLPQFLGNAAYLDHKREGRRLGRGPARLAADVTIQARRRPRSLKHARLCTGSANDMMAPAHFKERTSCQRHYNPAER